MHGLCPNRSLALSGVFYNERCESFLDPAVDKRWQLEASAPLFAYGRPPSCRPCPAGCRCPGGNRCLTAPGFYNDKESLDDKSGPMRCAVPKLKRCPGQAQNANGGSVCGDGYAGKGCELCGNGYRKESGACSKCPETNYAGAFTLPLLMNFGGAALAFPALVLLKLIFAVRFPYLLAPFCPLVIQVVFLVFSPRDLFHFTLPLLPLSPSLTHHHPR